jgi:uncharacterized membrane protein YuzA (DUF378 family)
MKMNALDKAVYLLVVVGGLNWGLVGAFKYNLVDGIFGADSTLSRVVYVLVGLAAVYGVYTIVSMLAKDKEATTN